MNLESSHIKQLLSRLINEKQPFIQGVFGPRQVGEKTMIGQIIKETDLPLHYVSADGVSSDQQIWISQQWETGRVYKSAPTALNNIGANSEERRFCHLSISF